MSTFQSHSKASYEHQVPVKETIAFIAGYQAREWASLVAQMVKNLPAMPETWAQSLGWEDPLEKGMTTHSSILAQIIQRSLAVQSPWGCKRVRHDLVTKQRQMSKQRDLEEK